MNYGMMNGNLSMIPQQQHMENGVEEDPRLDLILQTSPFEEKVTRNGLQKLIRVVIKNSPFNVQLKLKKSDIDLNHVAFESTLLYDYDNNEEKEVDFVKCKPVEHKATPNEQGDTINVELRIKVLTSQHEDMFFRVKVEGQDPITKEPIKGLFCQTNPIKVISKPEQLKKKQPPKKRTWNDILMESVSKIQHQQNEQQKLIEKLIDYNIKTPHNILNATTLMAQNGGSGGLLTASGSSILNNNNNNNNLNSGKTEFEDSFKQMMNAYTLLDPRQRAEKVRRVFRNASSRDSETLSELLDLFITEGVGGPLGTIAPLPISNTHANQQITQQQPMNISLNNNNNLNSSPLLQSQTSQHPHLQQHLHLPQQQNTTTTNNSLSQSNQSQNSAHQPNPFLNHNNQSQPNQNQQNQQNQNQSNQNSNGEYPFFSTIPTSFDNEFNSFGSGNNDFIQF
ncbi:putative transcriptional regulator [Tieghemostelium lacteum]|uniref:Putative transcriptional regulator n=1 Tax=Tieghemostelium lacteum TaxID=361077 RepID=A0A151ZGC2_TIELA|nr:putative transcriptional regulator [Tieghemostelium lacteum]|eukprot:KYQ92975.1 putative transcriptional regulator [Tieghemostelium lacteum]